MPDTWELASIAAKFLLYLGAVQSAGLSFIVIAFRRETEGIYHLIARRSRAIVLLALVASGLVFSLKGAAMMGDASGMLDVEILGVLWQTPIRIELMLRVAGLVLILTGFLIAGIGIWIAGIGGILALWSFAWVGHVASFELTWLKLLLIVHLAGIAFWVGVLSPLKTLAADSDRLNETADLGHRFGQFAMITVPILVASGIVMAWNLLGEISALVHTNYGLVLLAKISALGVLLAVAAMNKFRLVPAIRRGERSATVQLCRSINVEWVLVYFIVLVTAVLTTVVNPPL